MKCAYLAIIAVDAPGPDCQSEVDGGWLGARTDAVATFHREDRTVKTSIAFSPLVVCALFTSNTYALECTTDADCPANYECDFAPSDGSSTVCSSDGDCTTTGGAGSDTPTSGSGGGTSGASDNASGVAEGGSTGTDPVAPAPPAPKPSADMGGATLDEPAPDAPNTAAPAPVTTTGVCEPGPIRCADDADCPVPTYCGDGGECVLGLVFCENSSECDADYQCTPLGGEVCSTSAGSAGSSAAGDPGSGVTIPAPANDDPDRVAPDAPSSLADGGAPTQELPPAPPPTETTCEPNPISACFPKPIACQDDAQCPSGWGCESVKAGGPEGFDDLDKACFPPGIAALMNGHVGLDSESEEGLGSTKGEDGSAVGGDPNTTPVPEADDPSVALGTQGGSEGMAPRASGCAVSTGAAGGSTSSLWTLLVAGAAFLTGARRRARLQPRANSQ